MNGQLPSRKIQLRLLVHPIPQKPDATNKMQDEFEDMQGVTAHMKADCGKFAIRAERNLMAN